MARRVYAKRYAQAVFEIALKANELDRWQSDLQKIACLSEDATIVAFGESPKFLFDDKVRLFSERLGDINPLALNLVYLLIVRGRLSIVGDIADEYQRLLDAHHGIERAEVTAAIPLANEDKLKLGKCLGTVVGREVVIKPEVDSSLIGGFVARIGGKFIDGSIRGKLLALGRELAGKT